MADNITAPDGGVTDPMMQDQQVQPQPTALDGDQSGKGPVAANTAGAPVDGEQKPDQAPKPGQPQQQQQQGQNDQQGSQDKNQQVQNPQAPQNQPPASVVHPAVQKASLVHDIAQALAGGPRFQTSIDPNTGTTTRTQVPVSGKQLAMAIALQALGGAVAGLGAKGPNNESQALQAGFAQGAKQQGQVQQAEQHQEDQASGDIARQASITQTNFLTHQNAMRVGQMDYDQHKQYVADAEPVLQAVQQLGSVKASGILGSDLMDKYHVTKDMAIVDGVVPRMNADGTQATNNDKSLAWDNTYSVIDPEAKISLPDETAKFLADHHVSGYFKLDKDGKTIPINLPDGSKLKARMVVDGLATASAIRLSEAAINNQLAQLSDPGAQKKFEISLTEGLQSGAVSQKALKAYAQFSNVPFSNLRAEMEKAKVDPDTVGQIMSLIPKEAIDASKQQVADAAAKTKADEARNNLVVSKSNYDTVIGAPKGTYTDAQVSAANAIDKQVRGEKTSDAYNAGRSGEQGRIDAKKANGIPLSGSASGKSNEPFAMSDPSLAEAADPKNVGEDGLNHTYLDALRAKSPQRAALIQAIVNGQRLESFYGLAKKDGQELAGDVHAADPSFDQSKVQEYNKGIIDFSPSGKSGAKLLAANTALKHLGNLVSNTNWVTGMTPDFIGDKSPIHIPGYAARKADMEAVSSELAKYYKGGAPDKEAVAALHKVMSATNPTTAKEGAAELADLLHGGIDSLYDSWKETMPSKWVPKQAFVDAGAAKAYKLVTGQDVDPKYLKSASTPGGGSTGQPQFTHYSASGKFGWDGKAWVPVTKQQ